MFTIEYLKAAGYSLEEKWLFLHHFKDVGSTYVATMRELGVSDSEIKEDLIQMLAQMSDASKKIKGQVIDIIPGFVSASSKWFQTLGLEKVWNHSVVGLDRCSGLEIKGKSRILH